MTNRSFGAGLALVLIAILFLAVNAFANVMLSGARLDLTQNRLYTISDGTRSVLAGLQEPVNLTLYYSEKLANDYPSLKTYGTRVREMLEEFAAASGGKVRLRVIDPEPFSEAEDQAVALGLTGTPLPSGETFYFGLSGTGPVDATQVIALFSANRQAFLEYDLTKLIYNLTGPKKKVVGIITALPMDTGPGGAAAVQRGLVKPYAVYEQLKQFFDVRLFAPDLREIGQHIDLLVIAHPPPLSDQSLYAIDQFVMNGGRVLVLVDPFSEIATTPGPDGRPPQPVRMSSNLDKLFAAWGIKVDGTKIAADRQLAVRVSTTGSRTNLVDYVLWLNVPGAQMTHDDVVTGDLNQVMFGSAGTIQALPGATTTVTPLITTTTDAAEVPMREIQLRTAPEDLLRDFQPGGKALTLAARVQGPVKTAFPNGPPKAMAPLPQPKGDETVEQYMPPGAGAPELPQVMESRKPLNAVVIADSDVLDDRFWIQEQDVGGQRVAVPVADNGSLIVNAVDNLSGNEALIGLRSRGETNRPFEVIEALRRDAERAFLSQEQALQAKLETTQREIADLRQQNPSGGGVTSAETEQAIARARTEVVQTRRELREVQRNLQRDIETLETSVKVINIGLVPVCVAVAALIVAGIRLRRRRRAKAV